MKRNLFKGIVMGIILMTSASASAQIDLSNLGKGLGQVLGTNLTSVLTGNNNVTVETLTGTWSYQQPAVIFESSNLLKQAGGKLASATIEKKLAAQLTKAGITPGNFLITFTSDKQFSVTKNGAVTSTGTYAINGSKITFSYLSGVANLPGYAQIENGTLSLTFDSSKVLNVLSKLGKLSSNSTLGTVSSLAGSFDGMKTGLAFVKYVAPQKAAVTTTKAKTTTKKAAQKSKTRKKTTKK